MFYDSSGKWVGRGQKTCFRAIRTRLLNSYRKRSYKTYRNTELYKAIDYLKVQVYVLIEQQEKVLGRNCDFELKNGSGFCLQGLSGGPLYSQLFTFSTLVVLVAVLVFDLPTAKRHHEHAKGLILSPGNLELTNFLVAYERAGQKKKFLPKFSKKQFLII